MVKMPQGIHKCKDCIKFFEKKRDYNKHRKTHDRPYPCALCDRRFGLNSDLQKHRITHRWSPAIFKCPYAHCNFFGTHRKDYLSTHLKRKHATDERLENVTNLPPINELSTIERERFLQEEQNLAFMEFVGQGNKEEVERLLSEDSSTRVAARDRTGSTPLEISIQKGHDDIFKLLLRYGANVSGESLYKFAHEGQFECVEILLRHGVDINASNDSGETALHGAASNGHESLLRFLIEKGADCQASDVLNRTPLHCAALKGHVGVAIHLLASGAYVDSSSRYYGTALHISAKGGHVTVASLLLEGGADANSMDGSMTPLHYASQRRCPEMIRMLLKADAHVSARTDVGHCPLSFALGMSDWSERFDKKTHVESAKLLLAAGAEFSLGDWRKLSHEHKEMFANYRPAEAKWTQVADSTTVPWSAESDEKYADVLRSSNRDSGQ